MADTYGPAGDSSGEDYDELGQYVASRAPVPCERWNSLLWHKANIICIFNLSSSFIFLCTRFWLFDASYIPKQRRCRHNLRHGWDFGSAVVCGQAIKGTVVKTYLLRWWKKKTQEKNKNIQFHYSFQSLASAITTHSQRHALPFPHFFFFWRLGCPTAISGGRRGQVEKWSCCWQFPRQREGR